MVANHSNDVNGLRKVLDSPVVLSSLAEDMRSKVEEDHSIWVKKKGASTVSNCKQGSWF